MALDKIKWGILGLAEIRRGFETIQELKSGNLFLHSAAIQGNYGCGFLVNKRWKKNVIEFRGISERIVAIVLDIHSTSYIILQIHAPTSSHEDVEIEEFYEKVQETIETMKSNYKKGKVWIIGDYNSSIGKRRKEESKILGQFGVGKRNKRGEMLVNFASEQNMEIVNTFFEGTIEDKWTWKSPKGTLHEIDYFLCDEIDNVAKVEFMKGLTFHSDHRMIQAHVNTKRQRKHIKGKSSVLKIKSTQSFNKHLNTKINKEFQHEEKLEVQQLYDKIEECIKWAVQQENKEQKPMERIKSKKLTQKTKDLIAKREELNRKRNKTTTERIEHAEIRKLVRREIRKDVREYEENIIKEIMETTGSTKSIKKELSQNSKYWIPRIEGKDKRIIHDREEIVEEATKFYEELYSDLEKTEIEVTVNFEEGISKEDIYVLEEEIEEVIKDLKKNKAPGIDNITNELIMAGKEELTDLIAYLFTEVLCQGKIPKQWEVSKIILLHKKDKREKLTNYRPITLSCVLYKMFMKVIQRRISSILQENQPCEQAGFRRTFSTIDHIHSVNQIIEKSHEYNKPIYISFIDYSKAFDSLKHRYIWETLVNFGVDHVYVYILREIYKRTRAFISLDKNGREFELQRGVRQGCPASPDLFNAVLEAIFRDLDWEEYGINVDGKKINNLRFADDVVLMSENHEDMEKMINELRVRSKLRGLEININKTKLMTNREKKKIMLGEEELKYEDAYVYLGQTIVMRKHLDEEIHRRINLAWKKYWSLKKIMKGNLSVKLKGQVLQTCIFPTLIYGCQAWAMTKAHQRKLACAQNKIMRSILGIKLEQKIRTKDIEKRLAVKRVENIAAELKLKWAGHMMRTQDNRWSKAITEWIPRDRKRNRGRQKKRWKDEIVERAGPTWMRRTRNKVEWRELCKTPNI
ncbi:hypothetical protein M8J76_007135 [Diaphorina citri]|nr:hypothetical protein M8J76_007135 [Diaphorina citri]KAI5753438.1 hypothetical protein M8J77_000194 [Diaphorina citri]